MPFTGTIDCWVSIITCAARHPPPCGTIAKARSELVICRVCSSLYPADAYVASGLHDGGVLLDVNAVVDLRWLTRRIVMSASPVSGRSNQDRDAATATLAFAGHGVYRLQRAERRRGHRYSVSSGSLRAVALNRLQAGHVFQRDDSGDHELATAPVDLTTPFQDFYAAVSAVATLLQVARMASTAWKPRWRCAPRPPRRCSVTVLGAWR
jgi:hypothetical protein